MKKYKFAHFADVHWRGLTRHSEYKRAFSNAFETLRNEAVDAIFIAGDIVHSKTQGISPELIDSLCWWFRNLEEIAPTYVALGNHDGLIMNKDREDAISPIVRALNLPELFLLKNSVNIKVEDKFNVSNFSCFDEDSWEKLKIDPDRINIALYHGAVRGSLTDIDWELDGEVEASMFSGYDFIFLGDIHKQQYLDKEKRIAYCGSTIQQNYGETPDKGFMIWEICDKNNYSSKHVKVVHDRPFVTIDWKGSVNKTLDEADNHPDHARFRIKTSVPIAQGEIRQLYSGLKEFKSATEIVMKYDTERPELTLESFNGNNSKLKVYTPESVGEMIVNYYEKAGLSERSNNKLKDLVNRFWKNAMQTEKIPGISWHLKKLEFDNTFGYGKGNCINFESIDGISGIFGQNRVGKSSICGTIMYTMFNTTDRGSISNLHVINSRKGHCKSKAIISRSGKNYLIERQTVKKTSRAGKVNATTHLNLFEVDENENIISDLAGEQRRDTEKEIRKIVGNPEDFLLTSLASQGEMSAFFKQKASSRKTVLSKFLELDVFEKLAEAARPEASGVRQLLNSVPNRDYEVTILDLRNQLKSRLQQREKEFSELDLLRSKIRKLELTLATRDDSGLVTKMDVSEQEDRVKILSDRKNEYENLIQITESKHRTLSEKSAKISNFKEDFPIEDLRSSLSNLSDLQNNLDRLEHESDIEKSKLKNFKKEVSKLTEVPCGDQFPSCKYITSAHRAKKQIDKVNDNISLLRSDIRATNSAIKKLAKQNIEEKIEKFNELISKLNNFTVEKSKLEIELNNLKNSYENTNKDLRVQEAELDEKRANLSSDSNADQLYSLRKKLKSMKRSAAELEEKYSISSEKIGLLQSDIDKNIEQKEEFDRLKEDWRIFELFISATSKNGIPLEVIRARLPEINSEIASILQGVAGFTVELESDEGSNEMNIYINYGDSKRIIECCSGMEKMMAAMAIRVALTNVSSLPKASILIIDEGFGALDSSNLEACSRFLESLKKWFRTIIVISHIDAIKDAADNIIEVSRKGPDAHVSVK